MYHLAHVSHWALAVAVLWSGIVSQAEADTSEGGQIQGNHAVDPKSYQVPNEHAAMQEAVTKARKTVGQFIGALQHPSPGESDFEVKKPFLEKGNVEHSRPKWPNLWCPRNLETRQLPSPSRISPLEALEQS